MIGTNTALEGWLSLSDRTNRLSILNDQLLLDGVAISGGGEAAPVNNFYSTNNFFVSGKGNTLVVTQSVTLAGLDVAVVTINGTNLAPKLNFTNSASATFAILGTSNVTITASGSGGGDSTGTNIVTLTQTGTNVSAMDFSLVQNGGVFKLSLTNNAHIPTPSNVGNTIFRKAWLIVQQPSTGTCFVTWTNGTFAGPDGQTLVNDTNNGAVVIYELVSDVFTNGLVHVFMSQKSKLMP